MARTPHGARSAGRQTTIDGVRITNPDRLLFREAGLSKLDLVRYYARVTERIVPHLQGRALSFVRCPSGIERCFFQRHRVRGRPAALDEVRGPDGRRYLVFRDPQALLELVQLGAIELHTWGARAPGLDRPDRMLFDLDPASDVPWPQVVSTARRLRRLLADLGLESGVMSTGGKGLHVVVPLRTGSDWDEVRGFAKEIAMHLERTSPDCFTARARRTERPGRTFVDYLRNGVAASAVCAYSVRARPGAPVAMPLSWRELDPGTDVRGNYFNVRNVPELLARRRDPWARLAACRQTLPFAALARLSSG